MEQWPNTHMVTGKYFTQCLWHLHTSEFSFNYMNN